MTLLDLTAPKRTARESDQSELGSRVALYFYIDNEMRVGPRLAALAVRFADCGVPSKLQLRIA